MKTIVILGSNGRIGHNVALAFAKADYRVIAVSRNGRSDKLPNNIERRSADALDKTALIAATKDADIIFNGLNPIYTDWHDKYIPMTQNVIDACKVNNAAHLFPGNVYNYGKEIALNTTEDDGPKNPTTKGKIRIEVEKMFLDAAFNDGVQTIILRAGDFYGAKIGGSWFDLVLGEKIQKGQFTYPGIKTIPHAWAYLPDLAAAFVIIANNLEKLQKFDTYNFEGHTFTGNEFQNYAQNALKIPLKSKSVPWLLLRIAGLFNGMMREISEMSYLWFQAHSLDGTKFEKTFGKPVITPPQKAVAEALQDLIEMQNAPATDEKIAA